MYSFLVLIEKSADGYGAYAPDLPGCVAVGDTVEEVEQLMHGALEMHISAMEKNGEEIPRPTHVAAQMFSVRGLVDAK